ncbi:MAG: hypothetical protein QM638_02560 [Nocardioides sp.]|uniref:hypothetical protein n=1 Tax=Nocardioides sp. TaxID=35761 RepID=UPI0039E26EF2
MEFVAAPGLVLTAYTAEPASPSADDLKLLATWAATEAAQHAPTLQTNQTDHPAAQPRA